MDREAWQARVHSVAKSPKINEQLSTHTAQSCTRNNHKISVVDSGEHLFSW